MLEVAVTNVGKSAARLQALKVGSDGLTLPDETIAAGGTALSRRVDVPLVHGAAAVKVTAAYATAISQYAYASITFHVFLNEGTDKFTARGFDTKVTRRPRKVGKA